MTCLRFSSRWTAGQSGSAMAAVAPLASAIGVKRRLKCAVAHRSGKGQDSPAASVRFSVSRTVERAMPSRRAISWADTLVKTSAE